MLLNIWGRGLVCHTLMIILNVGPIQVTFLAQGIEFHSKSEMVRFVLQKITQKGALTKIAITCVIYLVSMSIFLLMCYFTEL